MLRNLAIYHWLTSVQMKNARFRRDGTGDVASPPPVQSTPFAPPGPRRACRGRNRQMDTSTRIAVIGKDGLRGTIRNLPQSDVAEIELDTGQRLLVPVPLLRQEPDGSYRMPIGPAEIRDIQSGSQPNVAPAADSGQSVTVPVVAEQIQVNKHKHETGTVVVHVAPETHIEHVHMPLTDEHVKIERVEVNEFVTAPQPVREVGDVTIIPVYDEVLVVERRLLLREEIHVHRQRTTHDEDHDVPLRTEQVNILRSEPPADSPPPAAL
jgi:stress response protein YsnF